MDSQRDLLEGLSPLEIEFFSESEPEPPVSLGPRERVHLSRFVKWVVVIVAAAAVLVGIAAREHLQQQEARRIVDVAAPTS